MRLWGGTAEAPNCSMSQRGRGTADQMGVLVTGRATWGTLTGTGFSLLPLSPCWIRTSGGHWDKNPSWCPPRPQLLQLTQDAEGGRKGLHAGQLMGSAVVHRVGSHQVGQQAVVAAPHLSKRCLF